MGLPQPGQVPAERASLPQIKGHGVGRQGREYVPVSPGIGGGTDHVLMPALVPAFRLFFHPPAATVAQSPGARQSARRPRIIVPRGLLSLTPDSPDSLGGESLNIPQGGSQPCWSTTLCCAALCCQLLGSVQSIDQGHINIASHLLDGIVCPVHVAGYLRCGLQ